MRLSILNGKLHIFLHFSSYAELGFGSYYFQVIAMEWNYYTRNSELREYFSSLPKNVQDFILRSGAEISTLGELMEVGEHFKREL
jgi:hypothetical protein